MPFSTFSVVADYCYIITFVGSFSDCGTVYTLDQGHVDFAGQKTTYDSKVPVKCDDGYEHGGDSEITCGSDGKWSKASCGSGKSMCSSFQ